MKRIIAFIKKYSKSPLKYARSIGVTVGNKTRISDYAHWSSEPYLIFIGDNCAVTNGVKFYTHGGGRIFRNDIPDYDCFGKIIIGNNVYIGAGSKIMAGVVVEDNVLVAAGSVVGLAKSADPAHR